MIFRHNSLKRLSPENRPSDLQAVVETSENVREAACQQHQQQNEAFQMTILRHSSLNRKSPEKKRSNLQAVSGMNKETLRKNTGQQH